MGNVELVYKVCLRPVNMCLVCVNEKLEQNKTQNVFAQICNISLCRTVACGDDYPSHNSSVNQHLRGFVSQQHACRSAITSVDHRPRRKTTHHQIPPLSSHSRNWALSGKQASVPRWFSGEKGLGFSAGSKLDNVTSYVNDSNGIKRLKTYYENVKGLGYLSKLIKVGVIMK